LGIESRSGELIEDYDQEWFAQRGIDDERVVDALGDVPRSPFVTLGEKSGETALSARALPPIEVVGKLVTALELQAGDRILEVGTDTGYITAVLAQLGEAVYTVERRLQIAKLAEGRLQEIDADNVEVLYGPRLGEYALNAPYDGILLSAVAPRIPEKLKERLAVGGRMVVPVGEGDTNPEIIAIRRVDDETFERSSFGQLRFSSKLGEILVELGIADRDDIELAALEADARGQRIGEALLEHSHVQEQDIVRALAIQRGHKLAKVDKILEFSNHELALSVPRAFLDHHRIIPLNRRGDTLSVATVDPDAPAVELAQMLEAESVEIYLTTSSQFRQIWNTILEGRRRRNIEDTSLKGRVESKFETVLRSADRLEAERIHIDNDTDGGIVRFRIDGSLRTVPEMAFEPAEVDYLVEFLKMGADLEVFEQRIPQRGRFSWVCEPTTFHLNVHVMPSIKGEQLSIQLLSHGCDAPTLQQLGVFDDVIEQLEELLTHQPGMFLIVGPRHAAKRQILYALLSRMARDESTKVASVEEDVQSSLDGVQQMLVHPERDFGYRAAIHEFVRFHVDILGIDEIPNPEIALEALNAARRGPKVLATLHGRDAAHVLGGLREFGVPSEALAHGISAILTQRMASRLCSRCRRKVPMEDGEMERLFEREIPADFQAYRSDGCKACDHTGSDGRVPIFELATLDERLRQAIISEASNERIRQLAGDSLNGQKAFDYAIRLASKGMIAVDELVRHME